jgi:hypothetical protein
MPKTQRFFAAFAIAVLSVAAGCNGSNNDDPSPEPDITEEPTETPSTETIGDFQLVGTIDEAFAGEEPDIDITGTEDVETTPGPTPAGQTPTTGGILRIQLDDLSEELATACELAADDLVELFWTTETRFPADVLDDIEDEIEERVAGVTGAIFRASDATDDVGATASPEAGGNCVLVADQVGFTTSATLPTPRSTVRRTTAPVPTRTPSPTPKSTKSPTAAPTEEPTDEPTDEPSPTSS